jgi:catechol 2,3-dioxygenase-like lactoylglutathione lyase family enzyme
MMPPSTSSKGHRDGADGLPGHEQPLPMLRLGEIVLRTQRFEEMKYWYERVLGVRPFYEHLPAPGTVGARLPSSERDWATQVRSCFFRLALEHPYQQVFALFANDAAEGAQGMRGNLHHLQLGDESPLVMARRYLELEAMGIVPFRAMDHGPTMSFYYYDPDGNVVEIAAPNHAEVAQFLSALEAVEFARNPTGIAVNPTAIVDTLIGKTRGKTTSVHTRTSTGP